MKLVLIGMLFIASSANSQGDVKWGDLTKSTGRLINIIPEGEDSYYALRSGSGRFTMTTKLEGSYHKGTELIDEGKLELRTPEGKMAKFEAATIVGKKFVVFLSDRQKGANVFYMQEYGSSMEASKKIDKLASYKVESGRRRFQGSFDLYQSQNRGFFAVVWTIPGRKEEHANYGFKIFNSQLEEVREGEYEVPFKEKISSINDFYLSDSGDLFVSITEYKESEKKIFRRYDDYVSVHIYHISEDDEAEMEIDIEGKRVEAMSFSSDNNRIFVITGIYGDKDKSGVTGLFYLKADFKEQEILAEGFEEFGEDFITSDWSDRKKKKLDKKKAKGKDVEPSLYSYIMRDVHALEGGGIVGTMEQYYVRVVTTYNASTGATTTTYYYYYNDVVAYKVGADGGFDWLAKIDKYQVSTNDGGYYSSYARYVSDGKLCLFFNDNVQNYSETSGEFFLAEGKKVKSSRISKKKNTVAICEIDLSSGESTRRMYFDRSELGAIVVPKLFNVDYINRAVLMYAIKGSKEKFGILDFDE
ncbi:MAG: hypothetical protein HRT57_07620 [Crocinitomicaceae bacterium]|nr:hypothetical protein [Crocinitomicaceae bacterium]